MGLLIIQIINKLKKIDSLIVAGLILFQQIFWLFPQAYRHLGTSVSNLGDGAYNLSLYLQNLLNWSQGAFFSLEGDHYGWYHDIIGVTAHGFSPSALFAGFYLLFRNPILSFNIIYLGNYFLAQMGIFFLVRYYTKSSFWAGAAALLVGVSNAFVGDTFATGQIHVAQYWALPFLIWTLEILVDGKNLTVWRRRLLLLAAFGCMLSLAFADWHVLLFSLFWIVIWLLFNLRRIGRHWQIYVALVLPLALLAPLIGGYLGASDIFQARRDLTDVLATNFETQNFYGIGYLLKAGYLLLHPALSPEKVHQVTEEFIIYPDAFTAVSFWLGLGALVPLLIYCWRSKNSNASRALMFLLIFLACAVCALGPFVHLADRIFESVPLPYYFLYRAIPVFQAIRACWRILVPGSLALVVLFALLAARLSKKSFWLGVTAVAVVAAVLATPSDKTIGANVHLPPRDETLFAQFAGHHQVFVAGAEMKQVTDFAYYVSYYNLLEGQRALEWVSGGSAGYYPPDSRLLLDLITHNQDSRLVSEILATKQVDLVVADKGDAALEQALSEYYVLQGEDENRRFYSQITVPAAASATDELDYYLNISHLQPQSGEWQVGLNLENRSDRLIIAPDKVDLETYEFRAYQDGVPRDSQIKKFGGFAFYAPEQGKTVPLVLKFSNLMIGDATIMVYHDDSEIARADVKILSASDYRAQVVRARDEALEVKAGDEARPPYNVGLSAIQVPISFTIAQGGILNADPRSLLRHNTKVLAKYLDPGSGEMYGFGPNITQPECPIEGNYFTGDELKYWCEQHVPFGDAFASYSIIRPGFDSQN